MNTLCWLLSVATNAYLVLFLPRRLDGAHIVKRAVIVVVAAPVVFLVITLMLRGMGAHPSAQFSAYLFAALFTAITMSMMNIANIVFHGMVDAVVNFHEQNNAANIHRFPISALINHREHLKIFASVVWCLGSALMLYGIWFDMAVPK